MEGRERFSRALPTGGAGGGVVWWLVVWCGGRRFVLDALERGIFSFSFVFGFARASRGMPRVGQWGSYGGGECAKEPKRTKKKLTSLSPLSLMMGLVLTRAFCSLFPQPLFTSPKDTHTHTRTRPARAPAQFHAPSTQIKKNPHAHTHISLLVTCCRRPSLYPKVWGLG